MDVPEEEKITILTSMMGDGDPEIARRVLRKHNGDMQKAATSILEGDTGAEDPWPADFGFTDASTTVAGPSTPPPSKPEKDKSVIDLTGDDENVELRRALEASLSTSDYAPTSQFRPSDRAPDPNWAMVPSNVEQPSGISQDDHYLSRAIQESMRETYNDQEMYTTLTYEQLARKDNRPVAIRPTQGSLVYAALLFQGLYYVPQVRKSIAKWRPQPRNPDAGFDPQQTTGEELLMWTLVENYAHMDLAVIGELNFDLCLAPLQLEPPGYSTSSPGELSYDFLQRLTFTIETSLHKEVATEMQKWPRQWLFHFRYGPADAQPNHSPFDQRQDMAIVKVDIRSDDQSADLVSALSARMAHSEIPSKQLVIFEPSDVVTFQLMRHDTLPSYSQTPSLPRQPFRYPKHIYLDQYMKENVEIASAKWRERREIAEKIQNLTLRENALKKHQNVDVSKSLQATLHYYEHVAIKDNPERTAAIVRQTQKLRKIIARIENELETIQTEKDDLKDQLSRIFEGPELREHRYDLRVVFMHDGVYGRNHLYSYVNDNDKWWKTVDWVVTEVSEETVLTDSTGFHLGAGPYMLIYSRAIPEGDQEPLPWPEDVVHDVQRHNQIFLRDITQGVATTSETVEISVPSSTSVSGFTTPLEMPVTPGEAMDVSN